MRNLVVALARHRIESAALVHRHEWSLTSRDDNVRLDGMELRVVRTGTWARILFTPISPAFPSHLWRLIADLRPDILHLHMPNPSVFWALLLPSARRIPWVVHWHADVVTAGHNWLMKLMYVCYRPFERAVLKRAAAVIVTSPPYCDSSEALRPWRSKCRMVPLGLDTRRLPRDAGTAGDETDRTDLENDSGPPVLRILAVGRLTYYKGFRYLIKSIASSDGLQLDLVGAGKQEKELKRLADSLGLQGRVGFHGSLDDSRLAQLMSRCDCLCLPSIERTEAFGLVLLEAMSFGKATVVSDVPGSGMGWIVDHGVTGLKVPPADSSALADAFGALMADRERLAEMGRAGRVKFERLFEINHAAEGIVDTYRTVLSEMAPRAHVAEDHD